MMLNVFASFAQEESQSMSENNKLDVKEGEKMYSGNMLFVEEVELKQYRENPNHIQELREAKENGFIEDNE